MIKPLGSNVLIKKKEVETQTSFGLVLSNEGKLKDEGSIVAVGEKVNDVKNGDTVLLRSWGGEKVTFDKQEYFIVEESQILAIIE